MVVIIAAGTVMYFNVGMEAENKVSTEKALVISPEMERALQLPPDPGEAGKQTLEGIDSDHDGVRDDMQRWIAVSQQEAPAVRAALRQMVRAQQAYILKADSDIDVVLANADKQSMANECLGYLIGGYSVMDISDALRAQMLNTKARSLAYVTADGKLSGHFFPVLKFKASSCDFDPANPPD